MFKHAIHGITIASILDRRRAAANGDFPVRIRVHYQKDKKYYATGKICSEINWNKLPTTKTTELIEMRNEIQLCFDLIKKHILELLEKNDFSLLNLDLSLRRDSGKTLNDLLADKISELKKEERIGTMQSYECTYANVIKFKGKTIPIESVTVDWLDKFEAFMLKSRTITTTAINMRNIRAMMNVAKSNGYIKESQYPFGIGKYEIKTCEGIKKALTFEQIEKIKTFSCTDAKLMWFRDIWLFIYYCNGINIADIIRLKYSDIVDGEILFIREKTKRTSKNVKYIRVTLTKEMEAIIKKWGNPRIPENYIFNLITFDKDPEINMSRKKWFTKNLNQNMKCIGTAVGIGSITSYTARHTYATVLKRKGINVEYISESLGHTSIETTKSYLDSFEKEVRANNASLL